MPVWPEGSGSKAPSASPGYRIHSTINFAIRESSNLKKRGKRQNKREDKREDKRETKRNRGGMCVGTNSE